MVVVFTVSHNDYDIQDESLAHRHVCKVMLLGLALEAINSTGLPFSSLSSPQRIILPFFWYILTHWQSSI